MSTVYDRATRLAPPPPVHLTPGGVVVGRGALRLTPAELGRIEPFHIDGFAGGGGASEGYYLATGRHADMAWNHDREALAMHRANHPFTKHFQEDIRRVQWAKMIRQLVTSAHFSPDCKDFSKAKGGKPKSKRIRGLAWTLIHMINELGPLAPLVLTLENVEEFLEWCPLLPDGRRNPRLLGWFFKCFVGALRRRGYVVEWRELRACEASRSPTIRKRLYLIARRDGQPIVWPEHLYGEGKPHRQGIAADILDFTLPCPSIFLTKAAARKIGCKRPLVAASCRRLAKGIERYVMKAREPFFVSYAQHGGASRSAMAPLHTLAASEKDANLLAAVHLVRQFGTSIGSDANHPVGTIMSDGGGKTQISAVFLAQNNSGMIGHDVRKPVSTILGRGTNQAVVAAGLVPYYGSETDTCGVRDTLRTVTTRDRFGYVDAKCQAPTLTPALAEQGRRVARFLRKHGVKVEGEFAMCGDLVIVDIGMRMLTPRELYRAQGFGEEYIIDRGYLEDGTEIRLTKTAQVRMCGNSVCPPMAEVLFRLNLPPQHVMKEAA